VKANQLWHAALHALAPREIESFVEDNSAVGQITRDMDQLPIEGMLPSFDGAITWLNSPQLTPAGLRGKVVLVDFCTYTCINWLRTLPYVRAWAEKYQDHGVVVIGVHSPEFLFEHEVENVRRAATDMRVAYPIAIDSDFAVWSAFDNNFWPALYIADPQGRIRHHHFGEGAYDQAEMVIQHLLAEAGRGGFDPTLVSVDAHGIEAPADWNSLESPETYLGYERAENFASPGGASWDTRHTYAAPPRLQLNEWALSGDWTVRDQAAVLKAAGGRIAFRFHARDLHLVLAPPAQGPSVQFRVLLDGLAPGIAHGADVDDQGNGVVVESRLYQLIRQPHLGAVGRPQPIADRQLEIEFLDPGVEAFVFTFG
jgi:thiol-disulfide isomerase/thioredoxin